MKPVEKTNIVVIEGGHLSKTAVSGGDKLIKSMIPFLQKNRLFSFTIIIPKIAKKHWQIKSKLKFYYLPSIFLENYPNIPLSVFFIYIWRSFYIFIYLRKIKKPYILYSSSAEIVDWLAAFLNKLLRKEIGWLVRIHHLRENPTKRPGNLLVNLFSFLIERVGLICFKKSDLILALNANIKKKISKIISANKTVTLSAGINYQNIANFQPWVKTPVYAAVHVGRIHYTKGILDLPIIWKTVVREIPNARLAIIGELSIPQLENKLKNQIADFKLENAIDILGFQKQEKVLSIEKKSKLFILCDHEAGFGLAAAEAMAAGLPVLGWDIGVLGTVFKSGYLKTPLNNHREFANMVVEVLKDKKLLQKLSTQARLEAKKFDWRKVSQQFEKIVIDLCLKKPRKFYSHS